MPAERRRRQAGTLLRQRARGLLLPGAHLRTLVAAIALTLLGFTNAEAQRPASASPDAPVGHWSYAVLRRLEAAGLLPPGADIVRRSIPQEEIASLLAFAAGDDSTSAAALYLRKFREEFGAIADHGASYLGSSARGYYRGDVGRVNAGVGYDTVWTGTQPVADRREGRAVARAAFGSKYVAGSAGVAPTGLSELQLVLSGRWIGLWAGRKEIGYAVENGGGLVLDQHAFDGAGVFLPRAVHIPVLGALRFEMHITKVDNVLNQNNEQHEMRPYLWASRGSLEPHPRFRIALNRGVMFGGEGNYPVTASRVIRNLLGFYTTKGENAFANQIASLDFRYRAPTGHIPVTLYVESASDDAYGAWWRTPARSGGFEIGPFQRADITFGAERTEFTPNRRSNSLWYQNAWLRGGWTDGGVLLGHPLGGHGTESRIFADGGMPARGVTAQIAGYSRRRGGQNLFSPERKGYALGATGTVDVRLRRAVHIDGSADVERGTKGADWMRSTGNLGVRLIF